MSAGLEAVQRKAIPLSIADEYDQAEDKPKAPQLEEPQEPKDEKTQSVVLMLNRYRDRMTPEQYEALYEQAMHGGTSAVLRELLAMLDAPIPAAAIKLRQREER